MDWQEYLNELGRRWLQSAESAKDFAEIAKVKAEFQVLAKNLTGTAIQYASDQRADYHKAVAELVASVNSALAARHAALEDATIAEDLASGKIDPVYAMKVADYIGRKGGLYEVIGQSQDPVVVGKVPDKATQSRNWNSNLWAARAQAYKAVRNASDLDTLRDLEVKLLGADGELKNLVRNVKNIPTEDRAEYGRVAQSIFLGVQEELRKRRKITVNRAGYVKELFDTFAGFDGAYDEWLALTKREPIKFVDKAYEDLDEMFDAAEEAKQAGLTMRAYGSPARRTIGFLVEEGDFTTYHHIPLTRVRKPCERHKDKRGLLATPEGRSQLFNHGDLVVEFDAGSEVQLNDAGELAELWLAEAKEEVASVPEVPELAMTLTDFVRQDTNAPDAAGEGGNRDA